MEEFQKIQKEESDETDSEDSKRRIRRKKFRKNQTTKEIQKVLKKKRGCNTHPGTNKKAYFFFINVLLIYNIIRYI